MPLLSAKLLKLYGEVSVPGALGGYAFFVEGCMGGWIQPATLSATGSGELCLCVVKGRGCSKFLGLQLFPFTPDLIASEQLSVAMARH